VLYEDNNIEYYSESDMAKKILTNPANGSEFTERYTTQWKQLRNPYKDAYYWLKGELLDLKGLNEALLGRETVVKQQSNAESKKRSDQQELEKLSQGKTTLKSLFKSKSSKETEILSLQASIEVCNKDIEDYKKLVAFLTVYHGEVAIQKFKREKGKQYLRLLLQMASKEISNSHLAATLWHEVMGMISTLP
jgi:dGTP triphosphohydrolase